ncbi:MAG: 50S ribosomal protein L25 [bacterium]
MSEKIELLAFSRNSEKANGNKTYVQAEVYGPGVENKHVVVEMNSFLKVFQQANVSTLIDLQIDNQPGIQVIVREVQKDPLKDTPIHIDFYQVNPTKKLTTRINLTTKGTSPAVQTMGGILVKNLDNLKVECLPGDLVSQIEIDLAKLAKLKDVIRVEDIDIPANISVKNNPRDIIMSVVAQRKQTTETKTEVAEGEKTPEGEETADGGKKESDDKSADDEKKEAEEKKE